MCSVLVRIRHRRRNSPVRSRSVSTPDSDWDDAPARVGTPSRSRSVSTNADDLEEGEIVSQYGSGSEEGEIRQKSTKTAKIFAKFSPNSANKPLAQRSDAASTSHADEQAEEAETGPTLVGYSGKSARSPVYVTQFDSGANRAEDDDLASPTPRNVRESAFSTPLSAGRATTSTPQLTIAALRDRETPSRGRGRGVRLTPPDLITSYGGSTIEPRFVEMRVEYAESARIASQRSARVA